MRLSSLLVLIGGLGVAGASAWAARDYLDAQTRAGAAEEAATVGVIVAAADIGFGQTIEAAQLTSIDWPRAAVPQGSFTDAAALLPAEGQEPRRARRAIAQGELILAPRVSGFGEKVTIVQTLAPNHRAMAIKVDAETGVGGFVTPGDFVDILLTQGQGEAIRTLTILQNVRVIGVDQDADEMTDQAQIARTVTVEVTPEAAQRLSLAQGAGLLSLSLRNLTEERQDTPLGAVRLSDILQELSPVAEPTSAPKITVRRGVTVTEENL